MQTVERHLHQALFIELSKKGRYTAFFSGLQSGKSVAGADACCELIYYKKIELPSQTKGGLNPEFWILSRSFALADQAWDYFKWRSRLITGNEVVYTDAECKKMGLKRGDSRTYWLKPLNRPDGKPIKCRVRTAHDPEQMRATGVLLLAWCDESAHWKELAWQNLRGRGIVTPTIYLVTTTPKGKNWCYKEWYRPGKVWKAERGENAGEVLGKVQSRGTDPAINVVSCSSFDNPWADKAYLDALRRTMGTEYARQEIDGLFTEAIGLVYSYDSEKHKGKPPSRDAGYYKRVVVGADPGYGSAYAAVVLGKTHDGVWWVLDEWKKYKPTTGEILEHFGKWKKRWGNPDIFVDKRRPNDRNVLIHEGLPARANRELFTEKNQKTIMPMVRFVQGLLKVGKMRVAYGCDEVELEFENYRYPDRSETAIPKSPGENPIKYMDDLLDALRYGICSVDHYLNLEALAYERGESGELEPVKERTRSRIRIPTQEEYLAVQEGKINDLLKGKGWEPVR